MRGDRPARPTSPHFALLFTPHARGSTSPAPAHHSDHRVYPACAGIDQGGFRHDGVKYGLPRMRGDRPKVYFSVGYDIMFTPHARGSTVGTKYSRVQEAVYPACAGIDPADRACSWYNLSLPRMRGDRPHWKKSSRSRPTFTPHARGSTEVNLRLVCLRDVYPACAGIDL